VQTLLLFISTNAANEKEKKRKKCCCPLVFLKSAAHTVFRQVWISPDKPKGQYFFGALLAVLSLSSNRTITIKNSGCFCAFHTFFIVKAAEKFTKKSFYSFVF
jgi:hypothetical protein